ncbi:MAG: isochorismatase family protein [Actinobacteria bacterium]|nr:isochorismatase family protein [Actinomycetota bacterium]
MTATAPDVRFDEHTALVVVDVQNDFADPGGNLYVDEGDQIISTINRLVAAAREAGAAVVYTQDWHPETTPHFEKDGGIWPVHCVTDSWGAQLHRDLEVDGPIIRKGARGEDGYSGFTTRDVGTGEDQPTELQALLQARGISDLVVVGLAQDVCVKETVLDARRLGYATTVLLDATRPVNLEAGDDQRAVDAMIQAGADVHS